MITCPLCHKPVLLDLDLNLQVQLEDDNSKDNFHCPTYADAGPNTRWCHYSRTIVEGMPEKKSRYTAIIPPFYIWWWKEDQRVTVEIFGTDQNDWRHAHQVYQAYDVDEQGLLKLFKKFSNLKAFT
jgi:hypothetical protein